MNIQTQIGNLNSAMHIKEKLTSQPEVSNKVRLKVQFNFSNTYDDTNLNAPISLKSGKVSDEPFLEIAEKHAI